MNINYVDELTALGPYVPCPFCEHPMPHMLATSGICWKCRSGTEKIDASMAQWMLNHLLTRKQYHPNEFIQTEAKWIIDTQPGVVAYRDELSLITPLHALAIAFGDGGLEINNIARLLLARGADVNARDESGQTPLYTAVLSLPFLPLGHPNRQRIPSTDLYLGRYELIKVLLQRGADPNAATLTGDYPILAAVMSGTTSVVTLLAQHGANVHVKQSGNGLREWAEAQQDPTLSEVVEELLNQRTS